ncbi:MAG: substrate-binding domain-containing protein [Anaerolineae bacterium]|jgi:ABC-type Fe3+ transport system substrate-binding protein
MPPAPRLNKILFAAYLVLTVGVLAAALILPPVRAIAYAPLRDLIVPPPEPVVVSVLYSTEKAEWIAQAVERFEASRPRLEGRPIELELKKMGSREMYLSVLEGEEQPDVISPASTLQVNLLEDLSASRFARPLVDADDESVCRSVLETPLVLVAWKDRASVLWGGDPNGQLWLRLQQALTDPQGWESYDHPEWGYIKFGHTNPLKSNSGFQTLVLMTYNYFGKSQGLTSADILGDADFQQWLVDFEGTISKFGDSTGTYMEEIVAYGPSLYDFVAVYESTAIEQAENAVGRYGELQIYYPPATHLSDHPFCIVQGEWVTAEKARAAAVFVDFVTGREIQELALEHGFRPVDREISLEQEGSPFQRSAVSGLRTDLPPEVEVPAGNVLSTLLDFWARNVQP